jgi:TRAP-type C4-dicarboxylate transport system permease small subunit
MVALIFFGLTLYGGFIWLTARGKEDKIAEAKNILEAAAIGLAVIASSYALATFILSRLAQPTASGCCYKWVSDSTSDTGMRLTPSPGNKEDCEADGGDFMASECPAQ